MHSTRSTGYLGATLLIVISVVSALYNTIRHPRKTLDLIAYSKGWYD